MAWHRLCDLTELPPDRGREFIVAGRIVAAFRTGEQVRALDGMCAHQGGPLAQGQLDKNCLTCPWHGWQYDVTNGRNLLTGKQMLDTFVTELRDSQVSIEIE